MDEDLTSGVLEDGSVGTPDGYLRVDALRVPWSMRASRHGLVLGFDGYGTDGYGTCAVENDFGEAVYLEVWEGELCLVVWADVNSEEPTHTISLEGARVSLRKED